MEPTQSRAKNALEGVKKLLSDKQQSTLIPDFRNPLEYPFPELYCVDFA
jgi:hypothetical protein